MKAAVRRARRRQMPPVRAADRRRCDRRNQVGWGKRQCRAENFSVQMVVEGRSSITAMTRKREPPVDLDGLTQRQIGAEVFAGHASRQHQPVRLRQRPMQIAADHGEGQHVEDFRVGPGKSGLNVFDGAAAQARAAEGVTQLGDVWRICGKASRSCGAIGPRRSAEALAELPATRDAEESR